MYPISLCKSGISCARAGKRARAHLRRSSQGNRACFPPQRNIPPLSLSREKPRRPSFLAAFIFADRPMHGQSSKPFHYSTARRSFSGHSPPERTDSMTYLARCHGVPRRRVDASSRQLSIQASTRVRASSLLAGWMAPVSLFDQILVQLPAETNFRLRFNHAAQ